MRWLVIDLLAAVALLAIRVFFAAILRVKGSSMQPTLRQDDFLLMVKTKKFQRGDIVICHYPQRFHRKIKFLKQNFVKRVVGLPGELVELENGVLYINGEPLEEAYLDPLRISRYGIRRSWQLDSESYFVLGDNRRASRDSRSVGPLPKRMMVGKVESIILPTKRRKRFETVHYIVKQMPEPVPQEPDETNID